MLYLNRNVSPKMEEVISTFSAVYLGGPRQCGKSTLVQNIIQSLT